ncbi:uncharacterized protein A4U43_C02F3970 [Asparagus officinalis]|uniref:USP domain-containing protein n=1 Tax=Asparagus officinalis TaxID=4686 RepID=A0A5P1FFN7_ASPOF|nr:ubiquitin carboxyl-terminal hydrolase 2-like [Asparagus officinalis]ONK77185.1 uncharacterized protein A4U43_C02F3970 [Asparagus officinalis]
MDKPPKEREQELLDEKFLCVCLDCEQIFCGDHNYGLNCHMYWHAKITGQQLAVPIRARCSVCESLLPIRTKEEEGNKKVELHKDIKEEANVVEEEESMEEGNENVELPKGIKEEMMLVEKEEFSDLPSTKVVRRMKNFGSTCYYNSVLQNLLSMKRLRLYFPKSGLNPDHPITSDLWNLFLATSYGDADIESSHKSLFDSICSIKQKYKENQQQDCHEFLGHLHEVLMLENNSLIPDVFEGIFAVTLSCCQCGHTNTSHEKFYDLSLSLTLEERSAVKDESFTWKYNVLPARENYDGRNSGSSAVKADNAEICSISDSSDRCSWTLTGYIGYWLDEQQSVIVDLDKEEEKEEEGEVPAAAKVGKEDSIKDKDAKLDKEDSIDAKENKKKKMKTENLKKEEKEEPIKDAKEKEEKEEEKEEKKEETKNEGPSDCCGWHPCNCNIDSSEVPKLPETERILLTDKEDQIKDKGIKTPENFPESSMKGSNLNLAGESLWPSYSDVSSSLPGSVLVFDYDASSSSDSCASSSSDSWSPELTDFDLWSCGILNKHPPTVSKRCSSFVSSMSNNSPLSIEMCLDLFTASGRISRECDHCPYHLKDTNSGPQNVKAIKTDRIYRAPPILTIHLKRFEQDARGITKKIDSHVSFQEVLDLTPYMDHSSGKRKETLYRLLGVVVHKGRSMDTGHYIAYVKGAQGEGCGAVVVEGEEGGGDPLWFKADDNVVKRVSLEEVLRSKAYLLFYETM